MLSMDIILALPGWVGGGGLGRGTGSLLPFQGRTYYLALQPMACNSSNMCHPGLSGCVLRPLVIEDCLMEARSLRSDVQTGVEASGL